MTIKFVKQDCWIGLFWKTKVTLKGYNKSFYNCQETTYYLCLVPCFPISWTTKKEITREYKTI